MPRGKVGAGVGGREGGGGRATRPLSRTSE